MLKKKTEGPRVTFFVSEKLDVQSAPELEENLKTLSPIIKEIVFDFTGLDYISSMGLRNILIAYKTMKNKGGKFSVRNIPPQIQNVFEMSGFMKTFERDEKLVIVEKALNEKSAVYALVGTLDESTASGLEKQLYALKDKKIETLSLDCADLSEITAQGCASIKNVQQALGGGGIQLMNTAPKVSAEIAQAGLDYMLPAISDERFTHTGDAITYTLKKEWELPSLPFFNTDWYKSNAYIKKIVLDFTEIQNISPESFTRVVEMRKLAESHGVKIDLEM